MIKAGEYTVGATTDIQDETGQQKHEYELMERSSRAKQYEMRKVSVR